MKKNFNCLPITDQGNCANRITLETKSKKTFVQQPRNVEEDAMRYGIHPIVILKKQRHGNR